MKIYYINKNSSKCIFNTSYTSNHNSIRLYSLISFLPYIHLFHGSTQLYLIYGSVLIMAIIAASQQVVTHKSKHDKMKEELDNYKFMKAYNEMLDEKIGVSDSNSETLSLK